jgi:hypothetical protein
MMAGDGYEAMNIHGSNMLVHLIRAGRIVSPEGLKSAYRTLVLKTHPDAAGSNRHLESYLELSNQYEEAKAYLAESGLVKSIAAGGGTRNHRLAFFQQLDLIESLEMPYAFHSGENEDRLLLAKQYAMTEISIWRKELGNLYERADREYVRIKTEKPMGPYLIHALALNIRPLVHNIIAFHLTARSLYAKQARQNISGIMHQLEKNGCDALREFLSLIIEDVENGAAILD